ncbi:MAG TPA: hypothetical protein VF331_23690 [Polyangiales bacterium]
MHILSLSTSPARPLGRTSTVLSGREQSWRIVGMLLLATSVALRAATAVAQATNVAAAPPAGETATQPTPAAEPEAQPASTTPSATPAATIEAAPSAEPAAPAEPSTKPTAPPYSLPWQLRPAAVGTVLRSDTAFAFYENPTNHNGGSTVASMLLGSYKLTDAFAPMIRLGIVSNSPPSVATAAGAPAAPRSGFAVINPVIGGTYLFKLTPELKLAIFLGLAIPVGMGGGDKPDVDVSTAVKSGILARSAMDNAMFAVNDFTVFPGIDLAYVAHGLTVQGEATLLQLTRVRGDKAPAAGKPAPNPDSSKTNFTAGLHVGYFVIPALSLGAELRHQRWLSTPLSVKKDLTDTLRDNSTFAIGVRFHAKLGEKIWLRPGLSYSVGLDNPMAKQSYKVLQLDIPVVF